MALIIPDVPDKLDADLSRGDVIVSYIDDHGAERKARVTCPHLVLRPVIRAEGQTGQSIDVPLGRVTAYRGRRHG